MYTAKLLIIYNPLILSSRQKFYFIIFFNKNSSMFLYLAVEEENKYKTNAL